MSSPSPKSSPKREMDLGAPEPPPEITEIKKPKPEISRSPLRAHVLKNKGSVARDHLANERTFLAWTRTAFIVLLAGVAFVQMAALQLRAEVAVTGGTRSDIGPGSHVLAVLAKPLAVLCGAFAILIAVFGYGRYLAVQKALLKEEFPASRVMTMFVVAISMVVLVLALVVDVLGIRQ